MEGVGSLIFREANRSSHQEAVEISSGYIRSHESANSLFLEVFKQGLDVHPLGRYIRGTFQCVKSDAFQSFMQLEQPEIDIQSRVQPEFMTSSWE